MRSSTVCSNTNGDRWIHGPQQPMLDSNPMIYAFVFYAVVLPFDDEQICSMILQLTLLCACALERETVQQRWIPSQVLLEDQTRRSRRTPFRWSYTSPSTSKDTNDVRTSHNTYENDLEYCKRKYSISKTKDYSDTQIINGHWHHHRQLRKLPGKVHFFCFLIVFRC